MGTAMILGSVEAVIAFAYLAVVAVIAYKAMNWLRRPKGERRRYCLRCEQLAPLP